MVAVEATPGHDIGTVTLTGRLVLAQMRKMKINMEHYEVKRIYRKVRAADMVKYEEAKAKEHDTMIKSRKIAEDLNLSMKIGDVEYQGDGNKAIFYYIADERVDFRELIKVLADEFRVRIEMKQIGASGGGAHWRYWSLRSRTLLCYMDEQFVPFLRRLLAVKKFLPIR